MTDLTGGGASDLEPVGFLVSHRTNTFGSGVARFNEILAGHLDVPMFALFGDDLPTTGVPLLSFKVSEFRPDDAARCAELLGRVDWRYRLFLHDWTGTALEERLTAGAELVYCGNHEVLARVEGLSPRLETLWSPGLILDDRPFHPTALSVFSFGMAHKVRAAELGRLRELLDRTGLSYSVFISSANHETASIRDAQAVFEEVNQLFPRGLYFLGNLSDVAVFNYLQQTTFFAAFFPSGVRANNGTVAAAMEHGAVVITNLDEHSPPEYRHMENLIDINQVDELPLDRMLLRSIGLDAMRTASTRRFPNLAEQIRSGAPRPTTAPAR